LLGAGAGDHDRQQRHSTLQVVTRPVRMGDDAEDVAAFTTSLPEAKQLFAGSSATRWAAATHSLRKALEPYAGPRAWS
jgi:hypothetical protein